MIVVIYQVQIISNVNLKIKCVLLLKLDNVSIWKQPVLNIKLQDLVLKHLMDFHAYGLKLYEMITILKDNAFNI